MRSALVRLVALAACAALAPACAPQDAARCPGTVIADFSLVGTLVSKDVLAADPRLETLDPVSDLPDCTPDPADASAPIRYPQPLPSFDARLSTGPDADAAALCRTNGSILSGTHSGPSYAVEATADSAFVCNSACAASLRVVVKGDLAVDAGGAPTGFSGILVEVLAEQGGTCDACLPTVPGSSPPSRSCAARYALTGTPR